MNERERIAFDRMLVNEWNEQYPEGQKVIVVQDSGKYCHTVTTSKAQLLGGHTAVIFLEGITGCYSLRRVIAI
jgi:hypothetical protein